MREPISREPSLKTRLNRSFREPGFAHASVAFATAIATELIRAAEASRSSWDSLPARYPEHYALLEQLRRDSLPDFERLPIVREFTETWCSHLRWPVHSKYPARAFFHLPLSLIAGLAEHSSIRSVMVAVVPLRQYASAELRTAVDQPIYELAINAPVWIPVAVDVRFRSEFHRQIRQVIHHEAGHFRWIGQGLRSELIADARGIAAAVDSEVPRSSHAFAQLLRTRYPEIWRNDQVQHLVLRTKAGVRLIRAWAARRDGAEAT